MTLFFKILTQGLHALRRNFILVYAFLFFLFLLGQFVPQTSEEPSLQPKWIALFAIFALLAIAFAAGWSKMLAVATQQELQPPKPETPPEELPLPFSGVGNWFREFFSGIGEFFLPFLLGGGIQIGLNVLIGWGAESLVENQIGIPPVFQALQKTHSYNDIESMVLKLSEKEQLQVVQIGMTFMGAFILYGITYLLTMFWPALTILGHMNPLKAYGRSMLQFFKDPLRVLGFGMLSLLFFISMNVVLQISVELNAYFLILFSGFFFLVLYVYLSLLPYFYVAQVMLPPQAETKEPAVDS